MRIPAAATITLSLALIGCSLNPTAAPTPSSGLAIQGNVHGGQQPIVGAHVYLLAANTSGYGNASASLLNATSTGHSDSIGAYVTSSSTGAFSITGDYTCTPNAQVYIYALGGNPGAGINTASGLLAALGNCPATGNFLTAAPFVWVNEVSTIAAAYAFAGFATDATHVSSSGTPLARIGIQNAFANAANLANLATGTSLATTPAGNGTVPQAQINTLANILAACVNSTGPSSTACSTLFSNAMNGGTPPTDTATAAINIAHNPGLNVATLARLETATAPFQPSTSSFTPIDFTIALQFTGGGLAGATSVAIDSAGNAWVTQFQGANSVIELSSTGAILSGAAGYFIGSGFVGPYSIAIDNSGNVWTANYDNSTLTELSSNGTLENTVTGLSFPNSIAIDGSDNVWVANAGGSSLIKFSNSGVLLPNASGNVKIDVLDPSGIATDASGDAWAVDSSKGTLVKVSNIGLLLSGSGFPGGGFGTASVAIDNSGDAWVANYYYSVTKLSSNGSIIFTGATGGGLDASRAIAVDGAGHAWITNSGNASVTEFSNSGAPLSPSTGYTGGGGEFGPFTLAIDGSGNVWTATNGSTVAEFIGAATPVVTPLAAGVKNNTLGSRP